MFDPRWAFESQVRSIVNQVRPDRQTSLFSATLKMNVEKVARSVLTDFVRVRVGKVGSASTDVTQHVHVLADYDAKWPWLASQIKDFMARGKVLVFANSMARVEDLGNRLKNEAQILNVTLLHGDVDQTLRRNALAKFKVGKSAVMVATDLASRGLDITDVITVINFDIAKTMEQHVHRCGRTGRLQRGEEEAREGNAHTLLLEVEKDFAAQLVKHLELSKQKIPSDLESIAHKSKLWRSWQKRTEWQQRKEKRKDTGKGFLPSNAKKKEQSDVDQNHNEEVPSGFTKNLTTWITTGGDLDHPDF
eukprot:gnl/MRDRNA2_/MRDRNA2_173702_c0_seq1.p1 gnl/MRDRNA2_/MRDRNA2_173702_c0~~gnl/MRDRNA2_/MRDRNA2_173702_c0_seq1.p1  ORF type:complete len:355 (+),score=68.88 gnl/MRDRNA2_/MRDRNA2_173702_c0_seq1:152-1066(+)